MFRPIRNMRKSRRSKSKGVLAKASPLALPLLMAGGLAMSNALAGEPSATLRLAQQLNQAFIEVADMVSPAVVVITTVGKPGTGEVDESDDGSPDPYQSMSPQLRKFH